MESLGEISFLDTFYLEEKALKNIFSHPFAHHFPSLCLFITPYTLQFLYLLCLLSVSPACLCALVAGLLAGGLCASIPDHGWHCGAGIPGSDWVGPAVFN